MDLPTGAWKWFFQSGSTHREEFYSRGKEDGHSIEYDSLGNVISEGDYSGGLKTGVWLVTINDHSEHDITCLQFNTGRVFHTES
jgi:hypothetical protein